MLNQKLRLYGKADYIDKWGRLFVHYHTVERQHLDRGTRDKIQRLNSSLDGKAPLGKHGFYVRIKYAKVFAPQFTDDPNALLGHDITALCKVRQYTFDANSDSNTIVETRHGWTIFAETINVVA